MSNFNIEQIYNELEALDAEMLSLKKRKAELEYETSKYFESEFNQKLSSKPDKCGTVTINLDGYDVKYNVAKRVKWDQDMLDSLVKKIAQYEDPSKYVKIKYDVSETAFKHWPEAIQQAFMPARTMEHAGGKLTIVKKGD